MRILRAELDKGTVSEEVFSRKDFACPGGAGLVTEYLAKRLRETGGKLSPLVIATGLFAGTRLAGASIAAMGWAGPSGEVNVSVFGGDCASRLTDHEVKLISLEGVSPGPVCLHIASDGKASLTDASALRGMGTLSTVRNLRELYGERSSVLCCGPSAQSCGAISSVVCTDPDPSLPPRQAAGEGMGMAFFQRNLTAVVTEHSPRPFRISFCGREKERFDLLSDTVNSALGSDSLTGRLLPLYGPLPGGWDSSPWRELSPELSGGEEDREKAAWREKILSSGGFCSMSCIPGCTVRCSNSIRDPKGAYLSTGLDHETAFLFGSMTGIFGLRDICAIDSLTTDAGCDLIMTGQILGELAKAGVVPFGDAAGAKRLLRGISGPGSALQRYLSENGSLPLPSGLPQTGIKRGYRPEAGGSSSACFMCPFPWRAIVKDPSAADALRELASLMGWEADSAFPSSLEETVSSFARSIREGFNEN